MKANNIFISETEAKFLLRLIHKEESDARLVLSEGLFSDDSDSIGYGSAVLRQVDAVKQKLEKIS